MDAVTAQREYYARTAEHYDSMHIVADDEHGMALAAFSGLARLWNPRSILDVGAGTGRGLDVLVRQLPDVDVVGVEPVEALRTAGHQRGIDPARLIDGDVLDLSFDDDAFDFVIETGVLHHVPDPAKAVAEMVRVARTGVMISDSNKFGQGSWPMRRLKAMFRQLGLWNLLIAAQTRGRMHKVSEGDGVFYSYSVFDTIDIVRAKFPRMIVANTAPLAGFDLRAGAPQVMLFATR